MNKRSGRCAAPHGKRVALAVAAAFIPWGEALALPTGEEVVTPGVSVARPTSQSMQIDQGVQKGIINWQGFSIGASEHVNITQPNASAALLNRVLGNNPSEIFGRLTANGQVFLVNNAGVLFAPGASVSVGSLLASTLSITDQNFLNGNYQFYNPGNAGSVVNQGSIVTAGGYTAFVGPQVRNDGVIIATAGKVALGAGDRVSLDMLGDGLVSISVDEAAFNASVVNTGSINADGGTVMLKASRANALLDSVINTSGVIRAMSLVERNGEIVLEAGPAGNISSSGEMQASGQVSISGGSFRLERLVPDPMLLNGLIAAGTVNVNLSGDMSVDGGQIHTQRGQNVTAAALTVSGRDGNFATLRNESGQQTIALTGGLRIEGLNGNQATVENQTGTQTITVSGADGISVEATNGGIAILGKPFVFGVPTTDSQTITTSRLNVEGGSVQAGRQDLRVNGDLSVQNGAITSGGDQGITVSNGSIDVRNGSIGSGIISGGSQTISVTDGDHISVVGGSIVASGGTQAVSITGGGANAITLGSADALGFSQINGGLMQSVTAGLADEQGSITMVGPAAGGAAASIVSRSGPGGTQSIATSGLLSIEGGAAPAQNFGSGIFHVGGGAQTIDAAAVHLRGGPSGSGNGVFINSTASGNQTFTVAGEIRLEGGAGGTANRAGMVTNGSQTISGNPDLILVGGGGGADGLGNNVFINATGGGAKPQVINARNMLLAAGPGVDASATMGASRQVITTTGDVSLLGSDGLGSLQGVRIGGLFGPTPTPTDLTLTVGGDLLLRGGGGPANGVGLGSAATATQSNAITITALSGDVILESGTGAGARIGSSSLAPSVAPGDISITAGGDIQLNGVAQGTAIRTLDTVTLSAANISEAANGFIVAGTLNATTSGNTSLVGPNQVANFSGSSFGGDVTLNNSGALNVSNLSVTGNATLTNGGDVTVSGFWNSFGATSIATTGPDADLNVHGFVQSSGPMTLDIEGTVRVAASGFQSASLTSFAGQHIAAGGLEVTSRDGRFASVGNNNAGDQTIDVSDGGVVVDSVSGNGFAFITNSGTGGQLVTVSDGSGIQVSNSSGSGSGQINNFGAGNQTISVANGGGVDVRTLSGTGFAMINNGGTGHQTISVTGGTGIDVVSGGGFASISQSAPGLSQTLTVTNGDHISLNGMGGAVVVSLNGGPQTVSITGSGANAISIGSAGALGFSQFANALTQSVTAGLAGEQGSITIVGPAGNSAAASIVSRPGAGGTQTIATSGLLSITGGSAPSQTFSSGVFHNGSGAQTITAGGVSLTGGPGGTGNRVQIGSFGGGVPANAGNQIINVVGGEISVRGSDGGSTNSANIISLADQFIGGNPDILVAGGTSSVPGIPTNNFATIQTAAGRSQTIHAGTITVTNSATANADSFGAINSSHQVITTTGDVVIAANGGAARIGGPGPGGDTDLQLTVGGSLLLDGGISANGAAIGSSGVSTAFANDVGIVATGDVILNSGAGGARIGSAAATGTAGGDISISARSIQLNGTGASAAIRTLDTVSLHADQPGGTISESGRGLVIAGPLVTSSHGSTSLTGPNQVSSYNGSSGAGDVRLNNTGPLALAGITAGGAIELTNAGAVSISAITQDISVTSQTGQTISAGSLTMSAQGGHSASMANNASGDQAINVSGALTLQGDDVSGTVDITQRGTGVQQVSAGSMALRGGSGNGTTASIATTNTASDQFITVAGGSIELTGGTVGSGNRAAITSAGNQTIAGNPDIALTGGASSGAAGFNGAFIYAGVDKIQTINAGTITLTSGSGGINSGAVMLAPRQFITTTGDVRLSGNTSGGNLAGVRMGGLSIAAAGVNTPTDLTLNVGRDLVLAGGTAPGNVAIVGSTGGQPQTLRIDAARDVVLGSPLGSTARLGTSPVPVPGDISVSAGRDILVNGGGEITAGGALTLQAGGTLSVAAASASAGNARVTSNAGQTIQAQSVAVTAQNGRLAQIVNNGFGDQAVMAASIDIQTGTGGGAAEIRSNTGGQQTIAVTSDHFNVHGLGGGSATVTSFGNQTVAMTGIGPKRITLGSDAALGSSTIISGGDQTITGNADIALTGGSGPVTDGSNALIVAFNPTRTQRIDAGTLSLANSTLGGNNSVAAILGASQIINTTGDVTLTANASGGNLPGVRIGGLGGGGGAGTPTNLTLNVGEDLVLTGGTLAGNGVGIGSTAATGPAFANTITINAPNGSVILNSRDGGGARIGSAATTGTAGGDITILAGGGIELNGTTHPTAIRTLDNVTLSGNHISEGASGFIIAGSLNTTSVGDTSLTGPNRLASFSASSIAGNVTLNNTGALEVTGLSAVNASLTNWGDVTVGGPVTSTGTMNVSVAGALAVEASGAQDAMLRSSGGQNIVASALAVTARDGRSAQVWNSGPNAQTILLSGGAGLDVQTLTGGGFAQISADGGGNQTINVVNGDHINVNGSSGGAWIVNPGGTQTLSITGGGANAIALGSASALGFSQIRGGVQNITAGVADESGSISIVGADANATFTGFSSDQRIGGTQMVSTSGTLRIDGGNAPNQPPIGFATGLFHNGSGEQRVSAANIEMHGGSSGINNTAIIISSGGANTITPGDQVINVGGNIDLAGGSDGINNTAIIVSFANQTLSAGELELQGGSGGAGNGASINIAAVGANSRNQFLNIAGDLAIAGGAGGNAGIIGGANWQQTIFADNISLTNSAGGGNSSVGFILGGHQDVHARGDVTLTARASGGALPGVRIGGLAGAAPTATDLTLSVGGNLVLTGGTAANNGVGIGSTAATGPAFANTITINAPNGSVILNSRDGGGARIGSAATTGTAGGNITILAGGGIELNGTTQPTAIRTLDNVTLSGNHISEGANGFIIAGSLNTTSVGDTSLVGPNQLANFSASSTAGNVTLNNAGELDVGSLNAWGNATLNNVGNVTVSGPWTAGGTSSITVASDIVLGAQLTSSDVVLNAGGGSITEISTGAVVANTLSTSSGGITSLTGPNRVARFSGASGSALTLNNGVALNVTSLNAVGDATLTNTGAIAITGPWTSANATIMASGIASTIVETGGGVIETGSLTIEASDGLTLGGANRIGRLHARTFTGDMLFNNTGALEIAEVDVDDVNFINQGAVTVNGLWNSSNTSITTTDVGSDLTVNDHFISSFGTLNLNVAGALSVNADSQGAGLMSFGPGAAQAIRATSLAVTARNGNSAQVMTMPFIGTTADQTITVSGGAGIDVQAVSGGFAQISSGSNQTISVIDGDHFNINGAGGTVQVSAFSGSQTIALTGSGANALNLGSHGAQGASQLFGANQSISAGSIDIIGADSPATFTGISTTFAPGAGNTQAISTSGGITVRGGNAPFQFVFGTPPRLTSSNAGIFHNSSGTQTISASDITLRGGASGLNNGALIGSNAGGDQSISVSGSISMTGGAGGDNNGALIVGSGNQAISGNPHIVLTGGSGSGEIGNNSAFIIASGPAKTQTIHAADIVVSAGSGRINSSAGITGTRQFINTTGDLVMTGGASTGQFSGTRIGGLGGIAAGPTDLTLNIGGSLLMTGGSAQFNGASIGSTLTSPALPNSITINAGGDVVLNSGTAAGARIGSSTSSEELAPGAISVTAGGRIDLNGNSAAAPSAIRTLGNVTLSAGGTISEGAHGRIEAGSLTTNSGGDTALNGPNRLASFNATSGGDVSLSNTGLLDVTGLIAVGDASITNIGDVTVSGNWSAGGTSTITVGSDILLDAPMVSRDVVLTANDGDIVQTATGSITADSLTLESSGEIRLAGSNNANEFSARADDMTVASMMTFDTVNLDVVGSLWLLGGSTPGSAAQISADGLINISVGGDLRLAGGSGDGAFARILGYSDINLRVGGFLTMNAGSGQDAWARIQLASRDSVIRLTFPNLTSGGYFVNGVEGLLRDGKTGFLADNGVAAPDHQLIITYGEQ